jgi:hypothetical protein
MSFARHMGKVGVVAAVVAVTASIAVPAWASPNTTQYSNPSKTTPTVVKPAPSIVGGVQGKVKKLAKKPVVTTAKASPGPLPFTGIDLSIAAIVGVLLVVTGFAARRLGRPANHQ